MIFFYHYQLETPSKSPGEKRTRISLMVIPANYITAYIFQAIAWDAVPPPRGVWGAAL
jgi:hypothetical protein